MRTSQYSTTIEKHQKAFESGDKVLWDQLLRYYQGKFYTEETGASESEMLTTSVNLTFAITETALSTLIPANPAVTALARSSVDEDRIRAAEAFVNLALDNSGYRDEMELFVQDAVIYGRGITKTSWSVRDDLPVVRACDPRSVWFDLTTRRTGDIRYWIEATVLGEDEFKQRCANMDYASWANEAEADTYPKWMIADTGDVYNRDELRNYQQWVTVYEVYDLEANRVVHMLAGQKEPVMEDKLVYCPYDLLTLNRNGKDCRGLSEIALISPNQEEVNNLLTYWLNIVRSCVPKGMFDPASVDSNQLSEAVQAGLGTWSPVGTKGTKTLAESIGTFPMPQVPPEALALLEKVWNNITIVSALAEAQRGQVTGARTATELALIEGQLRNRLKSRQTKIDRVTASVAEKMLLLMQKYKTTDEVLRLTGRDGWTPVRPGTLRGIRAAFDVVPYSPMESNRAVVQEQFKELLQFLGSNPNVDQKQLLRATIDIFDNPALRRYNIIKEADATVPNAGTPEAPTGDMPPSDPAAMQAAAGMVPSDAPLPPTMQKVADLQASAAAPNAPVISGPGVPVGVALPPS